MPISAVISLPTYWQPGCSSNPSLGRQKVTVASALTHTPLILPSFPSTPEGMSIDSTGLRQSFIRSMVSAAIPVISLLRPVPNNPSITRSDMSRSSRKRPWLVLSSVISMTSRPIFSRISIFSRASPDRPVFSPSRYTLTFALLLWSSLAAANASPPLLPLPATIVTRLPAQPSIMA